MPNILCNYISHETLIFNYKDCSWFNSRIKSLLQEKDKIYKEYRMSYPNKQLLFQEHLNFLLSESKRN